MNTKTCGTQMGLDGGHGPGQLSMLDAHWHLLRYYGSHQRPRALLDLFATAFADREDAGRCFWRLAITEWPNFDAIPHGEYQRLFRRYQREWRADYMRGTGLQLYRNLPEQVELFRGQNWRMPGARRSSCGLSWTLDRDIATEFAIGCRIRNPDPVILTTSVSKSDVAFACGERNEQEVVLFRAPASNACKVDPLTR